MKSSFNYYRLKEFLFLLKYEKKKLIKIWIYFEFVYSSCSSALSFDSGGASEGGIGGI